MQLKIPHLLRKFLILRKQKFRHMVGKVFYFFLLQARLIYCSLSFLSFSGLLQYHTRLTLGLPNVFFPSGFTYEYR